MRYFYKELIKVIFVILTICIALIKFTDYMAVVSIPQNARISLKQFDNYKSAYLLPININDLHLFKLQSNGQMFQPLDIVDDEVIVKDIVPDQLLIVVEFYADESLVCKLDYLKESTYTLHQINGDNNYDIRKYMKYHLVKMIKMDSIMLLLFLLLDFFMFRRNKKYLWANLILSIIAIGVFDFFVYFDIITSTCI